MTLQRFARRLLKMLKRAMPMLVATLGIVTLFLTQERWVETLGILLSFVGIALLLYRTERMSAAGTFSTTPTEARIQGQSTPEA